MYQNFSKYYDNLMGDRTKEVDFIKSLLSSYAPNANSVLELGCGTGELLKEISQDYSVSGLDVSPSMLEIAKRKLPEVNFYSQDMSTFQIPEKFDVIFCVFDSVNHLTKFEDWENLFNSVHSHLNNDGIFIFDINTEFKLEKLSQMGAFKQEKGDLQVSMKVEKNDQNLYNWLINISEKQNGDPLKELKENILESSFPVDKVLSVLSDKFSKVDSFGFNLKPISETTDRAYFVCRN